MKVGDRAALFSHNGFRRFVVIAQAEVPSGIDTLACYETEEGSRFYMMPEIGTDRHYNVGNKAFWIIHPSEPLA